MLILGAGGFARQLLEIVAQLEQLDHLAFYEDDASAQLLLSRFQVLTSEEQVLRYFDEIRDSRFALGIGAPDLRRRFDQRFSALGGTLTSLVSPYARLARFDVTIGDGATILTGAVIETSVRIGRGCLVNLNATIAHDSVVGDYAEIAPGACISGNCRIGEGARIGSNATLLPGVTVGDHAVVGAGAVVTKDVPSRMLAAGVPAQLKKHYD